MRSTPSHVLVDRTGDAGHDGEPRLHWLVTGSLVSAAMWAFIIAVILAAFGKWVAAGWLLGLALVLVALLLMALRRARRIAREG